MKLAVQLLLLAPVGVMACAGNTVGCPPEGYCAGAAQGAELDPAVCTFHGAPSPCFDYDYNFLEDCDGNLDQSCLFPGDGFCDDGTFFLTNMNCATYNYDGGDCEEVYDCDGNLALLNKLGDGVCHDGDLYTANFDCLEFDYDNGDCAPADCEGVCLDNYPTDDGTCQEAYNCKKFEYSFRHCYPPECPDGWYDMGRENYRCSQRTGGDRFASFKMDDFNECECYDWCQDKAAENGVELTAFDHYSDKCRCWTGDCTDASTIACHDDGVRADEFEGTDGRCPSATYFPHPRVDDCHEGDFVQDVTMYQAYFEENYYNDGYCDNAQLGNMDYSEFDWGDSPIGDFSCDTFDEDGEDCLGATCDQIFEITNFAVLDEPNMVCDGHANDITKEAEWTTACDCYEFCAPSSGSTTTQIEFQRTADNMCQCIDECESQSNCGLESTCQIFHVERHTDCCGDDWTLGKVVTEIQEGELGEFYDQYVLSREQVQSYPKVVTLEFLRTFAQVQGLCVPEFMCEDYAFSFGSTTTEYFELDDDSDGVVPGVEIVQSPCLDCQVTSQEQLDNITIPEYRCDFNQDSAERYTQLKDYYLYQSLGGVGNSPTVLDDYCTCEIYCRLTKFYEFAHGPCNATAGYEGYLTWLEDPNIKFAVDSYKGDCRCWDYCTNETLWQCTAGQVDRCAEGDVAVVLWAFLDAPFIPPQVRGA